MTGKNAIQKYAVGAVVDVLGYFGVPTGSAINLYGDILDSRANAAFEILLSEIRQGDASGVHQNEAVSVIARYQRDAMEGVARNNLRLMARVINGMAEKKELKASTFLRYANILASLTEEEVAVLGVMVKHANSYKNTPKIKENGEGFDYTDHEAEELKNVTSNYRVVQQALVRTGLVFFTIDSQAGDDFKIDGGNLSDPNSGYVELQLNSKVEYQITPLMREIIRFVPKFNGGSAHG